MNSFDEYVKKCAETPIGIINRLGILHELSNGGDLILKSELYDRFCNNCDICNEIEKSSFCEIPLTPELCLIVEQRETDMRLHIQEYGNYVQNFEKFISEEIVMNKIMNLQGSATNIRINLHQINSKNTIKYIPLSNGDDYTINRFDDGYSIIEECGTEIDANTLYKKMILTEYMP